MTTPHERQIAQLEQEKAHLIAAMKDMWVLMMRAREEEEKVREELETLKARLAPRLELVPQEQQEAA